MWLVRIINTEYSAIKVYERKFIFKFSAKITFKKLAKMLLMFNPHIQYEAWQENNYTLGVNYHRITIMKTSVEDCNYPSDSKLKVFDDFKFELNI